MNRFSISSTIKKKHSVGFNFSWQYRDQLRYINNLSQHIKTKTLLGALNYNYTF
ncbi:MAG: hypothetical protein HYZ42_10895 [Bacteroidetes bacterium]|nr:hypothetical protein [Bacteroidota bacterium]